jgi:hypothetical protein
MDNASNYRIFAWSNRVYLLGAVRIARVRDEHPVRTVVQVHERLAYDRTIVAPLVPQFIPVHGSPTRDLVTCARCA